MTTSEKELERYILNLKWIIKYMESEIKKSNPKVLSLIDAQMAKDTHPDDPSLPATEIADARARLRNVLKDHTT